jgi:ribosome-associated translation inhibitor RaiA
MNNNPHIVWRNMERSEALEGRVFEGIEQLEGLYENITACRVVLEAPHRHAHGEHFLVKIELTVPGKVLVVARDPKENANAEDAYAAVSEAFDAMRRQLVDYARVKRGEVKRHVA